MYSTKLIERDKYPKLLSQEELIIGLHHLSARVEREKDNNMEYVCLRS